jgi:hypothetical protein
LRSSGRKQCFSNFGGKTFAKNIEYIKKPHLEKKIVNVQLLSEALMHVNENVNKE